MSGFPLGFNPILGSVGLVGVAINGAIVVLAAIRANPQARTGGREAIVQETVDATRHILATTLTTIGGFFTLADIHRWGFLATVSSGDCRWGGLQRDSFVVVYPGDISPLLW
ncbi:MAG: efflux RND transporter permease subunit [Candidatus Competibacteraceae bacterium]|nr:efflux RND transporter permease subunit [Candidatus Competibacteraceae bacterium]